MTDNQEHPPLSPAARPVRPAVYVEGVLRAVPTRTLQGPATELVWELSFDGGVETAGPAGVARLAPPGLRLTVAFDYLNPRRLLALNVSAGVIADRLAGPDSSHRRDIGRPEAALVDRLVGAELLAQLDRGDPDEINTTVPARAGWEQTGVLATLCTRLADNHRPLDGLWAAEAAHLVHLIDPAGGLSGWAADLAAAAGPALRALPAGLAAQLPPQSLARLHAAILACAHTGVADLGELAAGLAETDRDALDRQVEDALHDILAALPVHAGAAMAPAAHRAAPTDDPLIIGFRGGIADQRQPARLDLSARGLGSAQWEISDGHLVVSAELDRRRDLPHFPERSQVRATTSDGILVGAAMSMRQEGGLLHATLPLPPGVSPQDLIVCVGRDLPVEAITEQAFDRRQTVAAARQQSKLRSLAEEIAEILHPHDIFTAAQGSDNLAGARSLAWADTPNRYAAELEHLRLQRGGEPELTLEQTDQLTWAASQAGSNIAAELDRIATQTHDTLLDAL